MAKKPRVLIHLNGGLVEDIVADEPVEVLVIDNDDVPDDPKTVKLRTFPGKEIRAYVGWWVPEGDSCRAVTISPPIIEHYFQQTEEMEGGQDESET